MLFRSLKYDTDKKYTPAVSCELFTLISGPESVMNTGYRLQASVDYDLTKKSSVEAGYLIDHEFNVADPVTGYIVTVGWSYKL